MSGCVLTSVADSMASLKFRPKSNANSSKYSHSSQKYKIIGRILIGYIRFEFISVNLNNLFVSFQIVGSVPTDLPLLLLHGRAPVLPGAPRSSCAALVRVVGPAALPDLLVDGHLAVVPLLLLPTPLLGVATPSTPSCLVLAQGVAVHPHESCQTVDV